MAQTVAVQEKSPRTIVRQADYAIEYSDGTILVKFLRFSHPHVFTPYKGKDDPADKKGNYSVVGMMPKTKIYFPSKDIIRDRINTILQQSKYPQLPADRRFLRDGSLKTDKPEYGGHFTINAGEQRKPIVLGSRNDPKTRKPVRLIAGVAADEEQVWGGCWGNILIRPWWQNSVQWGKRVNAGLVAVQIVPIAAVQAILPDATDEAFGEGRITEEEVDETFGAIGEDDSGYDDGLGSSDLDDLDL